MTTQLRGHTTRHDFGVDLWAQKHLGEPFFMCADNAEVHIVPRVALKSGLRSILVVAVAAAAGFMSGCSGMYSTGSAVTSPVTGSAVQGRVHGGQFPVSGATIGLWAAGSTGYGSAATNLLTSAVTSGADGSFSLSSDYTCPAPNSLVYITASGGNPGLGANNSAIMLAAPLGACSSLTSSTFININEVTTAAMAVSLGQFFTTTFGLRARTASGLRA